MLKKRIALLLAAMMAVSALAGCGNTEESKESEAPASSSKQEEPAKSEEPAAEPESTEITFPLEEPVTFTGMTILWKNDYLLSDNVLWKKLQEDTNVKFDMTHQFLRAEAGEKGQLVMASGDYPDMVWKASFLGGHIDEYGMEGIFIPLEDLIREYMPNLCELMDAQNGWYEAQAADGHIYSLPSFMPPEELGVSNGVWWINQEWMDTLGLDMPTTYEEFYEVLKAFKEDDPNGNGLADEIPIIGHGGYGSVRNLLAIVGTQYGVQRQADYMIYTDNGLEFAPVQDSYKEFLGWMKKFYEEGLIEVNTFTQTDDQRRAMASSGDVIGMIHGTNAEGVGIVQEAYGNYVPLIPFNPDNYAKGFGVTTNGLSITDKCENPEILCAWADWFYTEEGGLSSFQGIQGVHWNYNEDGTWESTEAALPGDARAGYNLGGAATTPNNQHAVFSKQAFPENPDTSLMGSIANVSKYADGGIYTLGVSLPTLVFNVEEAEVRSVLYTDIITYVDNYCAEAITGAVDLDSTWEDFKKECEKMGYKDLEAIYQAADARTK